jgi:hypothetical protein
VLEVDADEVLDAGVDEAALDAGAAEVVLGAGVAEVELVDWAADALELIKVWPNACMIACIKWEPLPERPARLPPSLSPP